MNDLNYIFFEEYKRLDKLCGELYDAPHGVTHYIDDMKSAPQDSYRRISSWNTDLRELIRLRHIRNYLAHAEGAFHEDVCVQSDIDLIKNFHQRIMNQSDPLAMLSKMSQPKQQQSESVHNYYHTSSSQIYNRKDAAWDNEDKEPNIVYLLLASMGIAAAILFVFFLFLI